MCSGLGPAPELVETALSMAGDERWHRPNIVALAHKAEMGTRLILRNRSRGQRGAEEYGVPLPAPDRQTAVALVKPSKDGLGVGHGRYCSPRDPTHFKPSRELSGFL